MSILDGTDAIVNSRLFGSQPFEQPVEYKQVRALRLLTRDRLDALDAAALVRSLYEHVLARSRKASGDFLRQGSAENWRFTLNTKISEQNASREKQVEKRIALLAKEGRFAPDEWANQVPVASGLLDHKTDKKACVDLVHRTSVGSFDLIELKMDEGSGHALSAAMQALIYGVLYLFSYRWADPLGYILGGPGLLGAQRVRLIVLAPARYFRKVPLPVLHCLCPALNMGLAAEAAREGLAGPPMEIAFEQFADSFEWPCSDDELISAVLCRRGVLADPVVGLADHSEF